MTKAENKQRIKNEALNAIRKIYRNFSYSNHFDDEGSYAEQREFEISNIIKNMERRLSELDNKN